MHQWVGGWKNLLVIAAIFLSIASGFYALTTHGNPMFPGEFSKTPRTVLFDFTKHEDAGNADWRVDGAYSNFAQVLRYHGYEVRSIGDGSGRIDSSHLRDCSVLVIPEPQDPFSNDERESIVEFVENGGGLFYIADHKGSDRNGNGYDSWKVWNDVLNFDDLFGIKLESKIAGSTEHRITDLEDISLTENVSSFGVWSGTTVSARGSAHLAAYQEISGKRYGVLAYATYGKGRIVVLGDSSTFDDGTPDSENRHDDLHDGWSRYDDSLLAINIVGWLSQGGSIPAVPNAPQNLTAMAGDGYVKLTWEYKSTWTYVTDAPFDGGYGEAIVGDGRSIYFLRQRDSSSRAEFYRYNPSRDSWDDLSSALPNVGFENGVAMAYDYSGSFYVLLGGSYRSDSSRVLFYRYSPSSNSWTRLADAPHVEGPGDAIVYSGYDHKVYAFLGRAHYLGSYIPSNYSVFARYNPSSDSWEVLPFPPGWPGTDDGASLAWTGGRYIYAMAGEFYENRPLRLFARYDISRNTWENLGEVPVHDGIGDGGSMLYLGIYDSSLSDYIYVLTGNGCNETPGYRFLRYSISSGDWNVLPSLPYPVGNYVGNRLAYANSRIYCWQGVPSSWDGGGKKIFSYSPHGIDVEGFRIYRGTSSGDEKFLTTVNSTTFVDKNVSNGRKYYYYVTAYNSHGEGNRSNEVSAVPQASGIRSKKILFVDDDEGSIYSDYFIKAIRESGILNEFEVYEWDVYQMGRAPTYRDMREYGIVIWSTGYAYKNTLTEEDKSNLMEYLNSGGRLFLSSQDLLWDLMDGYDGLVKDEFVNNYLGVTGVINDVSYTRVYGMNNDSISSNFSKLHLSYPYTNYADEIDLKSNASAVFHDSQGYATASRYSNGNFKTVFFAFSFEAVEKYDPDSGARLLYRIVHYLAG